MKFNLPIIVEAHPIEATRETEYRVRPVFIPHVEGRSRQLTRAISRLTAETRKTLREVAKEQRHERLAGMVFSPELGGASPSVTIRLRPRTTSKRSVIAWIVPIPTTWIVSCSAIAKSRNSRGC